ncbi:hypothetical protein, partial [Salmonella enterica]|uniref:hypothetical protein n=1 Tax=Salmonella enterica TaxID=28901 RepID=UPI003CE88B19
LIPEQAKFIGDTTNIISFSYDRIYEMMKHCQNVELLGTVDLSEKKKIAFFYVKSEGLPIQTSSVMLEKLNGNYYLDLQENDNTLRSIF